MERLARKLVNYVTGKYTREVTDTLEVSIIKLREIEEFILSYCVGMPVGKYSLQLEQNIMVKYILYCRLFDESLCKFGYTWYIEYKSFLGFIYGIEVFAQHRKLIIPRSRLSTLRASLKQLEKKLTCHWYLHHL